MLMKLDASWLMFAVVTVLLLSYMLAMALDAILGHAGYGPVPNAVIITVGFFGAIYWMNERGVRMANLSESVMTGLVGSFALFFVLVVVKAVVNRVT